MRISDWSSDVCSSDLDRTKDARAEQAVTLGLERAVVDGFGLLDLAEQPRTDAFGARDADLDNVEGFGLREIGRASCRGRVCQYVSISGVGVSLIKKIEKMI